MIRTSFQVAVHAGALALICWTPLLYGEEVARITGPVATIQTDPHHPGTLLAGTAAAQLFRSRDGAETWSAVPFPGALRSTLHALLIDPARPNVYLLAVSSEIPQQAGVFRTMDEGATWQQLRGLAGKQVWALTFWKSDSQVIAAGTLEGVFLTRDGGENWIGITPSGAQGPRPVVSLTFDPSSSNILYAGTPHLVWKTSDTGATWRRISAGMEADSDIFSIHVDASRRSRVFAGACSGLYGSRDGGVTWFSLQQAMGAPLRTYVVVRSPDLASVVFAGTSAGLIRSSDGGVTWHKLSTGPARAIAFDPRDPLRIFVATDNGILRSGDGGHFSTAKQ